MSKERTVYFSAIPWLLIFLGGILLFLVCYFEFYDGRNSLVALLYVLCRLNELVLGHQNGYLRDRVITNIARRA